MNFGDYKMTTSGQKNFIIKVTFYALVIFLIYLLFKLFLGPLLPFILSGALALSLQPLVNRLCRKFNINPRALSVLLLLFLYLIIAVAVVFTVKALYGQITDIIKRLPEYTDSLNAGLNSISNGVGSILGELPDNISGWLKSIPSEAFKAIGERLGSLATELATGIAAGIPSFILSFFVMIVAGIYIAKDYSGFTEYINSIIPERLLLKLKSFKTAILSKIIKLLKGYLFIIILTFGELFLGLLILKVRYALIIAIITAFIDILPVLGSGTVLIPWAIFSALNGDAPLSIGLAVLYITVTAIRNFTEPKIIGLKLGIHPVFTLAAIVLGLRLFGTAGVILAPIITVTIRSLLELKYGQPDTLQGQKSASGLS